MTAGNGSLLALRARQAMTVDNIILRFTARFTLTWWYRM